MWLACARYLFEAVKLVAAECTVPVPALVRRKERRPHDELSGDARSCSCSITSNMFVCRRRGSTSTVAVRFYVPAVVLRKAVGRQRHPKPQSHQSPEVLCSVHDEPVVQRLDPRQHWRLARCLLPPGPGWRPCHWPLRQGLHEWCPAAAAAPPARAAATRRDVRSLHRRRRPPVRTRALVWACCN